MNTARHAPPSFTLSDLAVRFSVPLHGDGSVTVHGLCPADEPNDRSLSFVKDELLERALKKIIGSPVLAFIVSDKLDIAALPGGKGYLIAKDPFRLMMEMAQLFYPPVIPKGGIDPRAVVASDARLGDGVSVGPFSVVGDGCEIGDGCRIYSHVVLYENVKLGKGCVVHAGAVIREGTVLGDGCVVQNGAVIGADGFGYVPDPKLGLVPVPQVGTVVLEAGVDVGANTCVDRAAFGTTRVGLGSKLDNLVQVGHNVKIGRHSIVCGHAGIGGSVKIGNQVVIGGHVGIGDHLRIGDGVRIAGKSGVDRSLDERGDYAGYPVLPAARWRRAHVLVMRLPELLGGRKSGSKRDSEIARSAETSAKTSEEGGTSADE